MPGASTLPAPDVGVAVPWSEDVGAAIIRYHVAGEPLYRIAAREGMPAVQTMWEWKERHPEWAIALARARQARAERMADDGLAIVDDCVPEAGPVGKAREQAGYRRWLAGCLDRDTYGERPPIVAVQVNTQVVSAFGAMYRVQGE